MTQILVNQYECLRCGYVWIAKVDMPKKCPHCSHPKWNVPRKVKQNEG